jgi:hypothetical protein
MVACSTLGSLSIWAIFKSESSELPNNQMQKVGVWAYVTDQYHQFSPASDLEG